MKGKYVSHPCRGHNILPASLHMSFMWLSAHMGYFRWIKQHKKLKTLIARHKYSIRDKLVQLPLARHFDEKGHSVSQLKFMVIDGINKNRSGGNCKLLLRKHEVQWINFWIPCTPEGYIQIWICTFWSNPLYNVLCNDFLSSIPYFKPFYGMGWNDLYKNICIKHWPPQEFGMYKVW